MSTQNQRVITVGDADNTQLTAHQDFDDTSGLLQGTSGSMNGQPIELASILNASGNANGAGLQPPPASIVTFARTNGAALQDLGVLQHARSKSLRHFDLQGSHGQSSCMRFAHDAAYR